jgi:hypothetical protein
MGYRVWDLWPRGRTILACGYGLNEALKPGELKPRETGLETGSTEKDFAFVTPSSTTGL